MMYFENRAAKAAPSDREGAGGEFRIPVDDIHLEGPTIGV